MISKIFIILINFYQRLLSPFMRPCCRYSPTCSEYVKQHITKHDKTVEKLTVEIGELNQRIQDYEAKLGVVTMEINQSATVSVAGPVTLRANTGEEAENRMHLQMQKYVELKNGPNFLRVDQQDIRVKRGFTAGVRNFVVEE